MGAKKAKKANKAIEQDIEKMLGSVKTRYCLQTEAFEDFGWYGNQA